MTASVCVRVYSLTTASIRVPSLPECSVPPLLPVLYSGIPCLLSIALSLRLAKHSAQPVNTLF